MRWATAVYSVVSRRPACAIDHEKNGSGGYWGVSKPAEKACSFCLEALILSASGEHRNEEFLRTYMINGTKPKELVGCIVSEVAAGGYALSWPIGFAAWYEREHPQPGG